MRRLVAIVLAIASFAVLAGNISAQTGLQVGSNSAQINFPEGIDFNLAATSSSPPGEVRLNYRIAPDGVRASTIAQCSGEASFTCDARLGSTQGTTLIPGAEITYSWSVTADRATETTADQVVIYEDTRFDWQTLTEGNLTLWYYDRDEDDARDVLNAALESMLASSALLQVTVDYPVKVFLYDTAEDMQLAIRSDNEEGVITRGEVVYSDTAMVAADVAQEEIARHEIAHIVQRVALDGAYRAPDWVLEGMAVYMQSEPLDGQRNAIESAIENNTVFSVRSMSSASSGAISGNVFLYYGESWSLVNFLIETHGEQKFADYFRAINAGAGDAGALEHVYGFNQDGLENAWRESVGLPPRSAPTPDDGQAAGPDDDSRSNASSDDDSNLVLIIGIIALTAAAVAALLVFGASVARRLS